MSWTFAVVDRTDRRTFRVTIQSQHAWLPMTTTVTSAIEPTNQPPARISTYRRLRLTARVHRKLLERRDGRHDRDQRRPDWRRLSVSVRIDVHRTICAGEGQVTGVSGLNWREPLRCSEPALTRTTGLPSS